MRQYKNFKPPSEPGSEGWTFQKNAYPPDHLCLSRKEVYFTLQNNSKRQKRAE